LYTMDSTLTCFPNEGIDTRVEREQICHVN